MSVDRQDDEFMGDQRGRSYDDDDDDDDNDDVENNGEGCEVNKDDQNMSHQNDDDDRDNHKRSDSEEVPIVRKVNTGRWTSKEHNLFLEGLEKYGKEWKRVAANVGTRSVMQTRTHAQKYFDRFKPGGNKGGIWKTNEKPTKTITAPTMKNPTSSESGKANDAGINNDGVARNKDKEDDYSQVNPDESDADDEAAISKGKPLSRSKDQPKNKPQHNSYNPFEPPPAFRMGAGGMVPHPAYYGGIGVSESFASASAASGGAMVPGAMPQYPPPPGYTYVGTPTPGPHPTMGGGRVPNPFYSPHHHHNAGSGNAPTPSTSQQASVPDPYSAGYPDYYNTSLVPSSRASTADGCTDRDIMLPLNHVTMKRNANQEYLDLLKINCPIFHTLPSIDQSWFVRNICHFLHIVRGRRWFIVHQQWSTPYPVLEPMAAIFSELRMDVLKGAALQSYPYWILGESDTAVGRRDSPWVYRQGEGTWISVTRNHLKEILRNEGPKNILIIPSTIQNLDLDLSGEGGATAKAFIYNE